MEGKLKERDGRDGMGNEGIKGKRWEVKEKGMEGEIEGKRWEGMGRKLKERDGRDGMGREGKLKERDGMEWET